MYAKIKISALMLAIVGIAPMSGARAQSPAVTNGASVTCDAARLAYAYRIGVPCSALGPPIAFDSNSFANPALGPKTPDYGESYGGPYSLTTPSPTQSESSTMVNVYIFRTGIFPVWNAVFGLDGDKIAELSAGQCRYTTLHVQPGYHILKQRWSLFMLTPSLRTQLSGNWRPGESVYYQVNYHVIPGFVETQLSSVDPRVAEKELVGCIFQAPLKGG